MERLPKYPFNNPAVTSAILQSLPTTAIDEPKNCVKKIGCNGYNISLAMSVNQAYQSKNNNLFGDFFGFHLL